MSSKRKSNATSADEPPHKTQRMATAKASLAASKVKATSSMTTHATGDNSQAPEQLQINIVGDTAPHLNSVPSNVPGTDSTTMRKQTGMRHTSSSETSCTLQSSEGNQPAHTRPTRSTRGQNGILEQMETLMKKTHPGLYQPRPQPKKRLVNAPENIPPNPLAPQPKRQRRSKKNTVPNPQPLIQRPSQTDALQCAPKPIQTPNIDGSQFGFLAAPQPQSHEPSLNRTASNTTDVYAPATNNSMSGQSALSLTMPQPCLNQRHARITVPVPSSTPRNAPPMGLQLSSASYNLAPQQSLGSQAQGWQGLNEFEVSNSESTWKAGDENLEDDEEAEEHDGEGEQGSCEESNAEGTTDDEDRWNADGSPNLTKFINQGGEPQCRLYDPYQEELYDPDYSQRTQDYVLPNVPQPSAALEENQGEELTFRDVQTTPRHYLTHPPNNEDVLNNNHKSNEHDSSSHDVLEEHRVRNHAYRPPTLRRLQSRNQLIHSRKARHRSPTVSETDVPYNNTSPTTSDTDEAVPRQRAKRHSKSTKTISPTTLQFYPSCWSDVLTTAKRHMRRYVAMFVGFPTRETHLPMANEILMKVLIDYEHDGGVLEDGYNHTRDMDVLVFEEHSTFRGKMKAVARQIVKTEYKDLLEPDLGDLGENQQEYHGKVANNIANILEDGAYLRHGKDDLQGRTNNLAHPALKKLIVEFFYKGDEALARFFPEDFGDIVPERAVALAATCIYHCLQEYQDGYHSNFRFEGKVYENIYRSALDLISDINNNIYHRTKLIDNRRQWAREGMRQRGPADRRPTKKLIAELD